MTIEKFQDDVTGIPRYRLIATIVVDRLLKQFLKSAVYYLEQPTHYIYIYIYIYINNEFLYRKYSYMFR